MQRLFREDYHEELLALMADQQQRIGRTTSGIFYNTQYTRLSGSPETSLFNSLANAYISYIALTKQYSFEEAWNKLGIYGGDDGMTPDLDSEIFRDVAQTYGCKSTTEVVTPRHGRVKFLARVYGPNVWNGSANSCCDVPRTMTKFHLTPSLNGTSPARRFMEKIVALGLSDHNTPIISDLITKFEDLASKSESKVIRGTLSQKFNIEEIRKAGLSYNAQFSNDVQYVNQCEPWMHDYFAECFSEIKLDLRKWEAFRSTAHESVEHAMASVPTIGNMPLATSAFPVLLYNDSGDVLELNIDSTFRASVPPVKGDKQTPTNFTRREHTAAVKHNEKDHVLPGSNDARPHHDRANAKRHSDDDQAQSKPTGGTTPKVRSQSPSPSPVVRTASQSAAKPAGAKDQPRKCPPRANKTDKRSRDIKRAPTKRNGKRRSTAKPNNKNPVKQG
jgi:hypothetical protein